MSEYKITECNGRFEISAGEVDRETIDELLRRTEAWLLKKSVPTEADFLAALGPCGK